MALSITTDYAADTGDPSPYLKRIADSGFSHVHWCHHWNTDFVYSQHEVAQIAGWLKSFGLQLLDLHGSTGQEKNWASPKEYERLAGVELVRNRIDMTAQLGADVTIMHVPADPACAPLRRSLRELQPFARRFGVRIAIENGDFLAIRSLFDEYGPNYLGLCYDAGHGNLSRDGLDQLELLKDRLYSVHLHDNDGSGDQHNLLFSGTIDWTRLCRIMAESAYVKPVSMEVTIRHSGILDETSFLMRAREIGRAPAEPLRIIGFDTARGLDFQGATVSNYYTIEFATSPAGPWTNWGSITEQPITGAVMSCPSPMFYRIKQTDSSSFPPYATTDHTHTVTSGMIATGAVTTEKLADGAVTSNKLAPDALKPAGVANIEDIYDAWTDYLSGEIEVTFPSPCHAPPAVLYTKCTLAQAFDNDTHLPAGAIVYATIVGKTATGFHAVITSGMAGGGETLKDAHVNVFYIAIERSE